MESGRENIDYSYGLLKNLESDFYGRPQRLSQDFPGKTFMFVHKTQFEAHLQTQATEVGSTALEKTSIIRTEILLFLVADKRESEKLVMLLLLQVITIKTDRKAKYYVNCRIKVDTCVRTFVETRDSLASVIFDTRNFKRVNQFVIRDTKMLLDTN